MGTAKIELSIYISNSCGEIFSKRFEVEGIGFRNYKKLKCKSSGCEADSLISKAQLKILNKIQKQYYQDIKLLYGLFYVGLILTTIGYFKWYFRIQKTQDRITKIQLELIEIELRKTK